MRLNICWKSGAPPGPFPPPLVPPPLAGAPDWAPPAAGADPELEAAELEAPAAPGVPGGMDPFNRIAMRRAISGGRVWSCESAEIFTCTGFLLNKSCTVRVPLLASTEFTKPATLRKGSVTTSCALYPEHS